MGSGTAMVTSASRARRNAQRPHRSLLGARAASPAATARLEAGGSEPDRRGSDLKRPKARRALTAIAQCVEAQAIAARTSASATETDK